MTARSCLLLCLAVTSLVTAHDGVAAVGKWPIAQPGEQWISTSNGWRGNIQSIPDGAGGAHFVWDDFRTEIWQGYYQHFLSDGKPDPALPTSGMAIASGLSRTGNITAVTDGAGGLYCVWNEPIAGSAQGIHLLRMTFDGTPYPGWPPSGVRVCTLPGQALSSIIRSSDGTLLIGWHDQQDIHVAYRRVLQVGSDGVPDPAWPIHGRVAFSSASNDLHFSRAVPPMMVANGAGGWYVGSVLNFPTNNLRVQLVRSDGSIDPAWAAEGTSMATSTWLWVFQPRMVPVQGGVLVGWAEFADNIEYLTVNPLAVQRVEPNGTAGERHSLGTADQISHELISDGNGGAWAATHQSELRVYHLGANGYPLPNTPPGGRVIASARGIFFDRPALHADGDGGVNIVWGAYVSLTATDLYHTRVLDSGIVDPAQPSGGTLISDGANKQFQPTIAAGESGSLMLGWLDQRTPSNSFIGLKLHPRDPAPAPHALGVLDVANDQGGWVRATWAPSMIDVAPWNEIRRYSVWRAVSSSPDTWTFVDSVRALRSSSYSLTLPTTVDSVGGAHPTTLVRVTAHDVDGLRSWTTAALAGESVDNLAPDAPNGLIASEVPTGIRLDWDANTEPDVVQYAIHRGANGGFVPTASNRIALRFNSGYVDVGGAGPCYKVIAIDSHGNAGSAAVVFTIAVVDAPGERLVDWLGRAEPNPARATTSL